LYIFAPESPENHAKAKMDIEQNLWTISSSRKIILTPVKKLQLYQWGRL